MLRNLNDLGQYAVSATDGDIGSVVDFLLDDERWVVRYLVVAASGLLAPRQSVISTRSLRQPEWALRRFHLALTMAEVNGDRGIDPEPGVSTGAVAQQVGAPPEQVVPSQSATELRGYHTQGSDAATGHIEDFIVDDETWAVRYLVVATSNWWLGKKVLVAPQWTTRISREEKKLYVDLSREAIKASPAWNAIDVINREYEERLFDHYARPVYWDGVASRDVAPRDVVPRDLVPRDLVPRDLVPRDLVPPSH